MNSAVVNWIIDKQINCNHNMLSQRRDALKEWAMTFRLCYRGSVLDCDDAKDAFERVAISNMIEYLESRNSSQAEIAAITAHMMFGENCKFTCRELTSRKIPGSYSICSNHLLAGVDQGLLERRDVNHSNWKRVRTEGECSSRWLNTWVYRLSAKGKQLADKATNSWIKAQKLKPTLVLVRNRETDAASLGKVK